MRRFSRMLEPGGEKPRRLQKKDWLLALVVFVVSGLLAFWGLQLVSLRMGETASIALSPLCALAAAGLCVYRWQFESSLRTSKAVLVAVILVLLVIAAVAFVLGAEFNGQSLLYVAGHGMPDWSGFGMQRAWVWVFVPALGAVYIQIWTLVRALVHVKDR